MMNKPGLTIVVIMFSMLLTSCGDSKARKPLAEASLQDMTSVPGATYEMGSQKYFGYTKKVTLKSFYISKYNVSYKSYDLYTRATGGKYIDPIGRKYHDYTRSPNHPVDLLNWYQTNNYCQYLGKITGLPYDLPTEAQWEYVASNNGKPNWLFPTNNGKQELGKNFPSFQQYTHQKGADGGDEIFALPIGSIPCTPQGVCGLTGAVAQWTKTKEGNTYIVRGQGAGSSPEYQYIYERDPFTPDTEEAGVRCVINSGKPMTELKKIAEQHLK